MADEIERSMQKNLKNYLDYLDRLSEKYLRLSDQFDGKELDFKDGTIRDIEQSMTETESEISRRETERPTSGSEYFFTDGNKKNDSQIDYQVEQSNEGIESNDSSMDGVSEVEEIQAGIGLLDESQGNLMDVLVQPEDQNEELEQTLSNHSTLELFPQMITQMGKTSHRHHFPKAVNADVQRYRKMRQIGRNAEETIKPSPRGDCHDPCQSGDEHNLKAADKSCVAMFHSPVQRHSNLTRQVWGASSESEADRARRDGQWTEISLLMQSKESMNHTFTVSKGSHPCSPLSGKPQGQSYYTAVQSPAQSLRFNRSNGPYVMESSTVPKSPVWQQSLLNTRGRNHNGYGGSPKALARQNPVSFSIHEQHSRSPKLNHQDCHSYSRIRSDSLQSPWPCRMNSSAKIEEEFQNLYHEYVCPAKTPLSKSSPCGCSARRLEANIGSSASALSSLSPHRSNLRKRVREFDQDMSPTSQRPLEWNSSPGSMRHCKERRLHL